MYLETWQVEYNFLIPKLHEGKAQALQETSEGLEPDTTYYLQPWCASRILSFCWKTNSAMYTEGCCEE